MHQIYRFLKQCKIQTIPTYSDKAVFTLNQLIMISINYEIIKIQLTQFYENPNFNNSIHFLLNYISKKTI